MSERQIRELAAEFYHLTFRILDSLPELSGMEAGRIATAVEATVARELRRDQEPPETEVIPPEVIALVRATVTY